MKHVEQTAVFEQVLLSHTEMCYSVALALTRNPNRAQDLARRVIIEAWQQGDSTNGRNGIKTKLLTALRRSHLNDRFDVCGAEREATVAECT